MLARSLEQDVCAVYVRVGELVRVAEAQVDVGLRCEVEDGVDLVLTQHALDIAWGGDVAMLEGEVRSVVEHARVVQRCAVVELVQRDDVVVGVGEYEVPYKPAGAVSH